MLLIIAALYFLGIQSVATNDCPRLRCSSRRHPSAWNVLVRCQLSRDAAPSLGPARRGPAWPTLGSSHASGAGLCVSELPLGGLHPNASSESESDTSLARGSARLQLDVRRVSGARLGAGARLLCATLSAGPGGAGLPAGWAACARRVPRLELEEALGGRRRVVCLVCASSRPGDPRLVYHSISPSLLLRTVLGRRSDSSPAAPLADPLADPPLAVTLDLRFQRPVRRAAPRRPSAPRPSGRPDPSSEDVSSVLATSRQRCRWKCGWLPYCLTSTEKVCDGTRHCPDGADERWCQHTKTSVPATSRGSGAPVLSLPLVYALVAIGCVLGFVFLILCFLWAFCTRLAPHSGATSVARPRRRPRRSQRRSDGADARLAGDSGFDGGGRCPSGLGGGECPSWPPCCTGESAHLCPSVGGRRTVAAEPSTGCSSSGVFEESGASSGVCPHCGSRGPAWPRPLELEAKGNPASDSSSAISGCGGQDTESGTMETIVCESSGGHRYWTAHAGSRCRASSDSLGGPPPTNPGPGPGPTPVPGPQWHPHHHTHRSGARHVRRHAPPPLAPVPGSLSVPSHHQDWFLNLPATVRRSNDDTAEVRSTGAQSVSPGAPAVPGPGAEPGRLLPPPNLNPFIDEPHFRRQRATAVALPAGSPNS